MSFDKYVKQPPSDAKIWRYMRLERFESLVDQQALFFMQLKILEDKYEGYVSAPRDSDLGRLIAFSRYLPTFPHSYCVVNCWSMSNFESDTMWGRYVPDRSGIVIQSTVEKLNSSIDQHAFVRAFTGAIEYREPPVPNIEPGPEGAPFEVNCFYKRPEFTDEKEYRILGHVKLTDMHDVDDIGGIFVNTNLNILIQNIYVAPQSSQTLIDKVRLLTDKGAISAEVYPSKIGYDPYV